MTDLIRICPTHDASCHRGTGVYVGRSDETGNRWLEEVIGPIPLAEVLAERIAAVKAEASRRILSIAPEWMQRNLTARAADLALLYPGTPGDQLPEPERSEYLAGQVVWDCIRAIRQASNQIESALSAAASVDGATVLDVRAVDTDAGWPE